MRERKEAAPSSVEKLTIPSTAIWIRCCDALPEEKTSVLIHTSDGIRVGMLIRDTLSQRLVWDHKDDFRYLPQVSHWMPLPKQPGEE